MVRRVETAWVTNPHHLGAVVAIAIIASVASYLIVDYLRALWVPSVSVDTPSVEIPGEAYDSKRAVPAGSIPCYDPATMEFLGFMPAMTAMQVQEKIAKASAAAKTWRNSTFQQRRLLLKILLKYTLDNINTISRVSSRDSGKVIRDAILGEILVTAEKLRWLIAEGEKHLKPEYRSVGSMSPFKSARVEYHPVGVVGAIVPWNYPFHNILNPLTSAVFAGNALVVKASEHTSWSTKYYGDVITAALRAAGAPTDLVQIITGYGDAGAALVQSPLVGHVVFVGSTAVGRKVLSSVANSNLKPVTLELGGKDPFIVADDAILEQAVPMAINAAFFSCGQNCVGGERFLVHARVYNQYISSVVEAVKKARQGPPLGSDLVDLGAMCMPGQAEKVQELVDDAVANGARVLVGGKAHVGPHGQFFPPTVVVDVKPSMRLWREEVFGPVMTVMPWTLDEEVVSLANECDFALGSSVFCSNRRRANAIASGVAAGMVSINDFNATYMSQSLPFGGLKESGFGRFAGVEGLRAVCVTKSVVEDRLPLFWTYLPKEWHFPYADHAAEMAEGITRLFYSPSLLQRGAAALGLAALFLLPRRHPARAKQA